MTDTQKLINKYRRHGGRTTKLPCGAQQRDSSINVRKGSGVMPGHLNPLYMPDSV